MSKKALVFEIGSTTTLVNAYSDLDTDNPKFVGGAQAPTSVLQGDVRIGLNQARESLNVNLGYDFKPDDIYATSSAAGGLKMSVHGLVHDMTVRAAREAALGAGANLSMVTAGKLRRTDLRDIKELKPNIILIAGGVDYGERDTALYNAEKILELELGVPIIYAGNCENIEEIKLIFEDFGVSKLLAVVDNVYPSIDQLNVEPTRATIQEVFEEHITKAKGMAHVREVVKGSIIPTPGAVMKATKFFAEENEDVLTIDIGGATTDIHSVTEGTEEVTKMLIAPEPRAKRTVEGDLGLYVNRQNLLDMFTDEDLAKQSNLSPQELADIKANYPPIPKTDEEKRLACTLAGEALIHSLHRHSGRITDLYSTGGKRSVARGKDLTSIKYIIATGGALTRLPCRHDLLDNMYKRNKADRLLPEKGYRVLIDNHYIMASIGVLSSDYPEACRILLKRSFDDESLS